MTLSNIDEVAIIMAFNTRNLFHIQHTAEHPHRLYPNQTQYSAPQ